MATKVKFQKDNHDSSLFHFSLIKILDKHVVERKKMLWSYFLAHIEPLPQNGSPSMKTDKEEPNQENLKRYNIHSVMKMRHINKGGDKPSKTLVGKLSKKAKLQSMKDDKADKEIEEQVTSAQQAKLKFKI